MTQGVVYQAADGAIISANPAAERILDLSSEQMWGKTSMDPRWKMIKEDGTEVPGPDHPAMIALHTGKTVGPVIRGVFRPDKNDHVWLSITAIPLFEPGQTKPYQVYATFEDVTRRKQAEEALRESEEKFKLLAENSADIIYKIDLEREQYTYASPSVGKLLGYSTEEILSLKAKDTVTAESYAKQQETLINALASGRKTPQIMELEAVHKDGHILPFEIHVTFIPDELGNPVEILGVARDISERKKAEDALRDSEARLKALSEASFEATFLSDQGICIDQNPMAEKMFGYSRDEAIGRHGTQWIDSKDREKVKRNMLNGYEKPYKVMALRKDGSTFPAEIQGRQFRYMDRSVRLTALRDITEQQRLEMQMLQTGKMEAIGTLTGGIAHDYNNLMAVIMGNLSLAMEEAEPGSDLVDFLNKIDIASRKIRDLTHELMSLSRGGKPVKEVGPLNGLLKSAINAIPTDSGISVNEAIFPDLWQVPHDFYKTGAVFRNVVTNAVEAMPDGGTLTIKAENLTVEGQDSGLPLDPGDFVHISIQDQGKGIAEEHMKKIFDPYFSSKQRGTQKGMGLGLTTAYVIVKQHQGHFQIESSPGVGTTVNIYFPAESGQSQWTAQSLRRTKRHRP